MRTRIIVFTLPAFLAALPLMNPARAAPLGSARTTITAHGIRLTLTLPGRVFPGDALVHATVTAQNVSHHPVWLLAGGSPSPGKSLPQIEVLSGTQIVYPPVLPWYLPLPGPGPAAVHLSPGKTLRASTYIILRGPLVRATLTLMKTQTSFGDTIGLATPTLTVTLTAPKPPNVSEMTTPGGPRSRSRHQPAQPGVFSIRQRRSAPDRQAASRQ